MLYQLHSSYAISSLIYVLKIMRRCKELIESYVDVEVLPLLRRSGHSGLKPILALLIELLKRDWVIIILLNQVALGQYEHDRFVRLSCLDLVSPPINVLK